MRIVGGRHRGRALPAPADRQVRPTGDRIREALIDLPHRSGISAPALVALADQGRLAPGVSIGTAEAATHTTGP